MKTLQQRKFKWKIMNSKIELERVKNLPVEKQSLEEPKVFGWVVLCIIIVSVIIAIIYACNTPDKVVNPNYSYETIDTEPYSIYPEGSIYRTIGPFWGFALISIIGIVIGVVVQNILDSQWKEYNNIVKSAKQTMIKREEERRAEQRRIANEAKQAKYNKELQVFKDKYGNPNRFYTLKDGGDIKSQIIPFGNAKRVAFLGKDLSFDDILSVQLEDDKIVKKGKMVAITKTDNGNMVKRAVVGDVLLGGAGAVIGGSTAEKNTTYQQEPDEIIHNYSIIVNIKDFTNPIIRINMGQDEKKSQEIVALINAIIASK